MSRSSEVSCEIASELSNDVLVWSYHGNVNRPADANHTARLHRNSGSEFLDRHRHLNHCDGKIDRILNRDRVPINGAEIPGKTRPVETLASDWKLPSPALMSANF